MTIHVHLPVLKLKKTKDAREQRFGLPVYTEEEIKQKIRNGEWEAETDITKGKRVELRQGSKRFQAYVKDSGRYTQADIRKLKARIAEVNSKIENIVESGGKVLMNDPLTAELMNLRQRLAQAKKELGVKDAGTLADLKKRIAVLETKESAFTSSTPLRTKAAVAEELKDLRKLLKFANVVSKDATFNLRERDGTNWGLWTASSGAEAKKLLAADIKRNPNKYAGIKFLTNGEPDLSQVRVIAHDARSPEEATSEANAATRKATSNGSFDNHYMAYMKHLDAAKRWDEVVESRPAAYSSQAKKHADFHRRQADFHFKNSRS